MNLSLPSFFCTSLAVFLLATFSGRASVPVPDGAVGWWRAQGNSQDFYLNGSAADSGVATYVPGFVGKAFSFSGGAVGVQVGGPIPFQVQNLTIEAWIKRADPAAASQVAPAGVIFGGGVGAYDLALENSGQLSFGAVGVSKVTSTGTIADTRWHHVAVSKDGGNVSFYVDGAPAGTFSYNPVFSFGTPFVIGSLPVPVSGSTYAFYGLIDELTLYNRGLSGMEIGRIYGAGSDGKAADTVVVSAEAPAAELPDTDFKVRFNLLAMGTKPTTNLTLNISLPASYTLVADTITRGVSVASGGKVVTTVERLLPGETATVTLTGHFHGPTGPTFQGQLYSDTNLLDSATATVNMATFGCPVPDGLVGWWRAEGDYLDAAGNGTPGYLGGAAFAPGLVGQAFSFAGGAQGVLAGNPSAFRLQDLSMEGWISRANPSSASQFGAGGVIFSGTTGSYDFTLEHNGQLSFGVVGVSKVLSTAAITDTLWHHVAVTRSGSRVNFYIDGNSAGSADLGATFTFDSPFFIGSLGAPIGNQYFTFWGLIDEFSLYNRPLTLGEVGTVYSASKAGKRTENIVLSTDAPQGVPPNTDFSLTFAVNNQGLKAASGVTLNVSLPAGFALVAATVSQGAREVTDTTVPCTFGDLLPGDTATVTLTGHSAAPATLVFDAVAARNESDLRVSDNHAQAVFEILGPCTPAPSGLVVSLRGDGNSNDDASHSVHYVGPGFVPGRVSQAFSFDGNSEVSIPDSPDLDLQSFTIEAWVYPTQVDGTVDIIANKEVFPDANSKIQFALGIKGPLNDAPNTIPLGNLAFFVSGTTGLPSNYGGWTDTHTAIPLNQWTHVALAVAPGTVAAYVNGVIAYSADGLTGGPIVDSGPLRIGSRDNTYLGQRPQDRFNGRIDEFAYYSRALAGGEIAAIFQAGGAGKCDSAIPPVIVTPPSNLTVASGTVASFQVTATGTAPLTYQWQFKGADILGATNSTLSIPVPRASAAGNYQVTVCNAAGCTPPVAAALAVTPVNAIVSFVDHSVLSPGNVEMPVWLIGNGVENALNFSLRFDTNYLTWQDVDLGTDAADAQVIVNSVQVDKGILGVSLALSPGAAFSQETNDVLHLRFAARLVNVDTPVVFTWGDTPTPRKVSDTAGNVLPITWQNGTMTIVAPNFEGDVSPLPAGNQLVDITDWVQVGRYVAGLDDLAAGPAFQRADCAPLATSGDGALTVSDWVQVGRFASGLDLSGAADGPTAPLPYTPAPPSTDRVIHLGSATLVAGQTQEIPVTLAASGGENAVGFSVGYDPAVLKLVGVVKGTGSQKATLNVNTRQAGKVGVALALNVGSKFPAGPAEVARLQFQAFGGTTTALAFGDAPVVREVASPLAEVLPVSWQGVSLGVTSPSVNVQRITTAEGPAIGLTWPASLTGASLETTNSLGGNWTAVTVTPTVANGQNTVVLPLSAAAAYFHLRLP